MIRTTLAAAALMLAAIPAQAAPISASVMGQEICELMAMGKSNRQAIAISMRANWALYSSEVASYGVDVVNHYVSRQVADRCPGLFTAREEGRI